MEAQGLDPGRQKRVLLWDWYSVRRYQGTRAWVKENYPNLILFFVPAGFTYLLHWKSPCLEGYYR